ncbi:MAG: dTMP kinase [Nitrospinaceae bacterium]|jgi:dTMP kinase|nr:dTMP kinase [Nitrospinaceae bacterium]MBT3823297.1 dTMP kinase [Nitrospinaceae bacterium]MBT4094704.1 dTMP kinase [Nitrospinaceae bacterium]MBT4432657.1 dTMP kinase [Nitrospinaceae bacterium]MBT5369906.1 dTMP kinase [Nitrospinaceae bacterium]
MHLKFGGSNLPGRFITFEGSEGAGKSTQLGLLHEWMKSVGLGVRVTREPGGTELGAGVREVLLTPRDEEVSPLAELLLYEADRAQHVSRVIRPTLEAGDHVLCDRFYDSTTAYQSYGRGLSLELVEEMNVRATEGLVPDMTLLLEASPEEGLRRARGGAEGDRLEGESLAFHERVWQGFIEIARREPDRFRLIPTGTIEEVHTRILDTVTKAFGWTGDSFKVKTLP